MTTLFKPIDSWLMKELFILILALVCIFLILQWRMKIAQRKIEAKEIPDAIRTEKYLSDGIIYYFYHPMCGPCRQTGSIIDELVQLYPDRVRKLNVAENQELTSSMGISATPTTVFIKNNQVLKATIGPISKPSLAALLNPTDPKKNVVESCD
jgi:thioredoxin-like negative regulator of GroEL